VDYGESVFNRATQAKRQPGSAFKPFVYLAALEAGDSPWDIRDDEPVDINGYRPTNFGGKYYGTVTLADALAHSINTITVNLAQEVGMGNVIAAARRAGITSPLQPNASLALGTAEVTPLELTSAYATFANGGYRVTPYLVTEISIAGKPVYQRSEPRKERVIDEEVNRDLTAMMYGVVIGGTGGYASLHGREAAGKTGTTQDSHDAWFVGFTTDYVAAAWVGNDDSSPTRGVTGGTLPAYIWRDTMLAAEKGLPLKPLDKSIKPPEEDLLMASGAQWDTRIDDEALGRVPEYQTEPEPPQPRRRRGGLLGWLFGDDEDEPPPER
jgi:penicillin-binding protein 1A